MNTHQLETIAIVESPFKERFGIPRQPGLVNAQGAIRLEPGFDDPAMLDGLEKFSHLWVTFVFHANAEQGWKAKVKPPRLGGKKQVGVFASRSPFRPNSLGLSVLKIEGIEIDKKPLRIRVSGLDLLDGTPIVDIKPYITYSDALPDAQCGFAPDAPEITQTVIFSSEARKTLKTRTNADTDEQLIRDVLALDPRPAYKKSRVTERLFGMLLDDYEVKWRVNRDVTEVMELNLLNFRV